MTTRKTVERLDSITTYRERVPTNPKAAYKAPNMTFDHSRQMDIIPDRKPKVLIENTNCSIGASQHRTMNQHGGAAWCNKDISIGGGPEHPGRVYRSGEVSKQPKGRSGAYSPKFKGK